MAGYRDKLNFGNVANICQGHEFFETGPGAPVKPSLADPWLEQVGNLYGSG